MKFESLSKAFLIKRYKRFLVDVTLADGSELTGHCPNTGAMTGCAEPGSEVWLSTSDNPKRKYPNTWELVKTAAGDWANIHSAKANKLVLEAIDNHCIEELAGYESIRSEVKYGQENSRADILLQNNEEDCCFVEVKSVTLSLGNGLGIFPDAVSDRARKHLRELMAVKQRGRRAVLLFAVLHTAIDRVAPADSIDSKYAETFREALAAGVEVLAYGAELIVDEEGVPQQMLLTAPLMVLGRQP